MIAGRVIVFDVGKTLAKLSLWEADGRLLDQQVRYNDRAQVGHPSQLDTLGIESWACTVMSRFAQRGHISAIVPVAHGAAAAVVRDGKLACPVPDYEESYPPELRADYDRQRDAFALTGSPALPYGLNLGAQLHRLEHERPGLLNDDAIILPWPQYWAWRMCGVPASEVSSLGCHSDLWRPADSSHSALACARGWSERLAPIRSASEILGPISPEWAARSGLSPDVSVYCGLHDSNAALLAAKAMPELTGRDATVLSTGTWFVAMRMPASTTPSEWASVPESRDCLVNVDIHGGPVPSARFMGGRELEVLGVADATAEPDETLRALQEVIATGRMVLPTWAAGVGPFPEATGRWLHKPTDSARLRAASLLYAALMVDVSLDLIGSRERILVEGRFAQSEIFVGALASLRPACQVYANQGENGVSYGALRLANPALCSSARPRLVRPLEMNLASYKTLWHQAVSSQENKT